MADGVEATYLAASLRGAAPEPTAASDRPAVAERLAELQRLREQCPVTEEEYAGARHKILGDL